jgi:hypothetical protein
VSALLNGYIRTQNHLADATFDKVFLADIAGIKPVELIAFQPDLIAEDFVDRIFKAIPQIVVIPGRGLLRLLARDVVLADGFEAATDVAMNEMIHEFVDVRLILF